MAKCSQIPVNKATLESDTVKMLILHHLSRAIKSAESRPTRILLV
ncbi:MAG: hypothetical protein ACLTUL_02295 [Blautia faecis]